MPPSPLSFGQPHIVSVNKAVLVADRWNRLEDGQLSTKILHQQSCSGGRQMEQTGRWSALYKDTPSTKLFWWRADGTGWRTVSSPQRYSVNDILGQEARRDRVCIQRHTGCSRHRHTVSAAVPTRATPRFCCVSQWGTGH